MSLFKSRTEALRFHESAPTLAVVREVAGRLSDGEMELATDQLMELLDSYYVHLPQKMSSLGIDPVRELRVLRDEVRFIPDELAFYERILSVVKRLRDRHTALRLPRPWRDAVAYLPFAIESFFEGGSRRVAVSKLTADVGDPQFVEGVEITHWNGTRIGSEIERLSWDAEGANPYARVAIALRSLTTRPLGYMRLPTEDWVALSYRTRAGGARTVVVPWRVYFPPADSATAAANDFTSPGAALTQGLDRRTLLVNNAWYDLYIPENGPPAREVTVPEEWRQVFDARVLSAPSGSWGYLRIYSFAVQDARGFVAAVAQVLGSLPSTGVVIDVRANPGGSISAGEGLLPLFTPHRVRYGPLSFRNTRATRALGQLDEFARWRSSLDMQVGTGEVFSQGFPVTPEPDGPGPAYSGRVVVVMDSLAYSTADFFLAGMQDNGLATIVGVDPVSGAGGANVWTHSVLLDLTARIGGGHLEPLPNGLDVDIAMRRSTRVGPHEGIPLEGLGVFAQHAYFPSRDDVLGDNGDLMDFACDLLSRLG